MKFNVKEQHAELLAQIEHLWSGKEGSAVKGDAPAREMECLVMLMLGYAAVNVALRF